MKRTHVAMPQPPTRRALVLGSLVVVFAVAAGVVGRAPLVGERAAHALVRGRVVAGGGARVVSRTTFVPGAGVSRTVAYGGTAGARIYRPGALIASRPGVDVGWTARGITVGKVYVGASTGISYRYGSPTYALPGGCTAFFWEGSAAYQCSGATYVYDIVGSRYVYYPVLY
jgi:hypothetical protein